MQLKTLIVSSSIVLFLLGLVVSAYADGTITMRGAYFKEHSTRVVQPMIDTDLDVGDTGTFRGHILVDSITSASAASGAVGQAFTENRSELGGSYIHDFGTLRFGGGARYSTEPDYQSRFINLLLEADFAQRNTTLGINIARGSDSIDNSGAQGGLSSLLTGELDTTMVSVSASQLLSPQSIISASYDMSYLDGFQQNIYRTVVAGGMVAAERVPDTRLRHALATNLRYHLDLTHTTLVGAYRFYIDDWGILGHAPEARLIQELFAGNLEVHLSYRYYHQRGADFYKDIYDSGNIIEEPFLAGDDRLGDVRNHMTGLKIATDLALFGAEGNWSEVHLEALVQYLQQSTHYGDAIISQLSLSFPIDY